MEEEGPICTAVPDWFPSLLSSDFFDPCEDHDGVRKNEVSPTC